MGDYEGYALLNGVGLRTENLEKLLEDWEGDMVQPGQEELGSGFLNFRILACKALCTMSAARSAPDRRGLTPKSRDFPLDCLPITLKQSKHLLSSPIHQGILGSRIETVIQALSTRAPAQIDLSL